MGQPVRSSLKLRYYWLVVENNFVRYLFSNVIVTVGAVAISLMAAYPVVRGVGAGIHAESWVPHGTAFVLEVKRGLT